ncbi:Protein of unknown function [Bacillus wiedmannii]|nr:Protein of unknown function [Bacillus wiedmannii]
MCIVSFDGEKSSGLNESILTTEKNQIM